MAPTARNRVDDTHKPNPVFRSVLKDRSQTFRAATKAAEEDLVEQHRLLRHSVVGQAIAPMGGGQVTPAKKTSADKAIAAAVAAYVEGLRRKFKDQHFSAAVDAGRRSTTDTLSAFQSVLGGTAYGWAINAGDGQDDVSAAVVDEHFKAHGVGLVARLSAPLILAMANRQDAAAVAVHLNREMAANERWIRQLGRTTYSAAWNRASFLSLQALTDGFPRHLKALQAVHDNRTHEDSLFAESQPARPLDDLFVDGAGRQYLYPPGRPNDREIVVPWREDWGAWTPSAWF